MAPRIPFAKRNQTVLLNKHDFAGESTTGFADLLGSDGKVRFDGEALVMDSNRFTSADNSSKDHYKLAWYATTPIKHSFAKEEILVTHVANKQIFRKNTAGGYFPSAYDKRVSNMQADPRLANGFVQLIGIHTGAILGFALTNDQIFAVVGVDTSICESNMFAPVINEECGACSVSDYDCNTYKGNPAWQQFKVNLTEEDFSRYLMFRKWQADCLLNGIDVMDWETFKLWRGNNPQYCDMGNRQMYSDWRTNGGTFDEYCIVNAWNKWIAVYKEFYACTTAADATCGKGYTNGVLFGNTGTCGSSPMCSHYFTSGNGSNCYDKKSDTSTDDYAQGRACCCQKPANFMDLIPIMRREACDPLMDWLKLAIGVDRANKTVNFYIANELKYSTTIGLRSNEEYRVIERGGFAKPLDLDASVFAFGTGSIMDASLPANYYRNRVTDANLSRTGLTNTASVTAYKEIYKNSTGALVPAEPGFFALENNDEAKRFGQGDIFKIKYFALLSRTPVRGYEDPRNYGKTECCGASACSRSCLRNTCEEECDSMWDLLDPRELQIEFEQPTKKRVGDDVGMDGSYEEGGDCGNSCVRAKIVKLSEGERYWSRQCKDDFVGINLY